MILTPWGQMEVADAHLHFFSPAFFESLASQKNATAADIGTTLEWNVPESVEYLADRWVVEMNHRGVDRAVIIGSVPGDVDSVGAAVQRHPSRFRSIVMVNPVHAGGDTRSSQALDDGLIDGVFLFPAMHRYSLHDTHVHSLLSSLSGRQGNAVVYVHCGMLSVAFRRKLGLPCLFDMRYANPVDLHDIALEFPHLSFVIPHFGAGFFRESLMLADLCPNVYLDTSSSNRWMATQPGNLNLTDVFRRALDVAGPKRLLFGTDSSWFPRGWTQEIFDAQVKALEAAGADAESARAVFGGNLTSLFRFSTE
ncbi:MAG TPA: amidohydrolase family protein [Bryobacteraceae bacterium]|nr:amidohydrolase family protein [Bryobacteraceae bacterium]